MSSTQDGEQPQQLCLFSYERYRQWRNERRNICTVKIKTPRTKIKGKCIYDKDSGARYVAFRGIPYALPPTGPRRFQVGHA